LLRQLFEGIELSAWKRREPRRGECDLDRAEEGNVLNFAGVWVGAREDGLEDAGEVERVER
jgi:hypothetical protein